MASWLAVFFFMTTVLVSVFLISKIKHLRSKLVDAAMTVEHMRNAFSHETAGRKVLTDLLRRVVEISEEFKDIHG